MEQYQYHVICLFQGATIVDQVVNITPAEDYIYISVTEQVYNWVSYVLVNEVTSTCLGTGALKASELLVKFLGCRWFASVE